MLTISNKVECGGLEVVRFLLDSVEDARTEIRCLGELLKHTQLFEQVGRVSVQCCSDPLGF